MSEYFERIRTLRLGGNKELAQMYINESNKMRRYAHVLRDTYGVVPPRLFKTMLDGTKIEVIFVGEQDIVNIVAPFRVDREVPEKKVTGLYIAVELWHPNTWSGDKVGYLIMDLAFKPIATLSVDEYNESIVSIEENWDDVEYSDSTSSYISLPRPCRLYIWDVCRNTYWNPPEPYYGNTYYKSGTSGFSHSLLSLSGIYITELTCGSNKEYTKIDKTVWGWGYNTRHNLQVVEGSAANSTGLWVDGVEHYAQQSHKDKSYIRFSPASNCRNMGGVNFSRSLYGSNAPQQRSNFDGSQDITDYDSPSYGEDSSSYDYYYVYANSIYALDDEGCCDDGDEEGVGKDTDVMLYVLAGLTGNDYQVGSSHPCPGTQNYTYKYVFGCQYKTGAEGKEYHNAVAFTAAPGVSLVYTPDPSDKHLYGVYSELYADWYWMELVRCASWAPSGGCDKLLSQRLPGPTLKV